MSSVDIKTHLGIEALILSNLGFFDFIILGVIFFIVLSPWESR